MKLILKHATVLALAGLAAGGMTSVLADEQSVKLTVNILVSPPCTINNNEIVNVTFKQNILTTYVNGINYSQSFNPNIVCQDFYKDQMRFRIDGVKATFDNSALRVNDDFAISILANSNPITIGDWQNFTPSTIPKFAAVPVKRSGAELEGQEFVTTGVLTIDYQ